MATTPPQRKSGRQSPARTKDANKEVRARGGRKPGDYEQDKKTRKGSKHSNRDGSDSNAR
ncbi:MAG: hypothetical protein SGI88_07865 [Candidatus Hydrogenedentes bacterium]|nr:hypothetical protein [Candidatus Hydrogenedentota bacterium]